MSTAIRVFEKKFSKMRLYIKENASDIKYHMVIFCICLFFGLFAFLLLITASLSDIGWAESVKSNYYRNIFYIFLGLAAAGFAIYRIDQINRQIEISKTQIDVSNKQIEIATEQLKAANENISLSRQQISNGLEQYEQAFFSKL